MKNLTWQNPEQLFFFFLLINQVKSKCSVIKDNLLCQHVIKEFHCRPTLFPEYTEDNNVILHSLNPEFQDIVLSATDNPRIVGKLIKVIHAHEQF